MKLILLTKGYSAKVSDDDYDFLSNWKWHYNCGYAERKENGKHIQMHRVILSVQTFVDHKNGDKLDNQRENLRSATHSTNAMNMRKHKGKSVYKGVSSCKGSWRTQIWKDNKKVFSASFPKERWSAMAYDLNAPALFGEFARLNFPTALVKVD